MHQISDEFKALLKRIGAGESVDDSLLLPFLASESKSDRRRINEALAEAYFYLHERGRSDSRSLRRARSCADRAWLLSEYDADLLPLLLRIHRAQGDVPAFKDALKRAGIEQAARGNFDYALRLFDRWTYAHAALTNIDTQSYDADIIACVERMTLLHRFDARPPSRRGDKVRVAYLMQGLTQVNSVLVRIDQTFARLHDKSGFEVAYFAVEDEAEVAASPDAQAAMKNIRAAGWELHVPPKGGTLFGQLLDVGRRIRDFEPDLLVTSAALATFKNYFVACMKPAPVTLALHQGATPMFTWHGFDHAISWFRTNLPDCPADCSYVPLEFHLPEREEVPPASRAELEIPEGATVAVSGGRWQKFQGPDFWRALSDLLIKHAGLYWLVVGVNEDRMPALEGVISPEARSKIRFRGWGRDYLKYLAAADVFVDSYPVGGGMILLEAMALGLPVVSFENDYVAAYDDQDSSGGTEVVGLPELLIKRGDFAEFKAKFSALTADEERRRGLGRECYERARATRSDPARMVRRCEEIYVKVLAEHTAAPTAGTRPRAEPMDASKVGEYARALAERSDVLGRREAELKRREAEQNARFLLRAERALRWRWRRLTGRAYLGYPE